MIGRARLGKALSDHFNEDEFRCRCGCGRVHVSPALLEALEDIREFSGIPVQITSGFRCPEHNVAVGGKPSSAHLTGEAADIFVSGNIDRFKFLEAAFVYGVRRVGIGGEFLHIDVSQSLPQEVCWLYGAGE
jgi:zinc D-Ala-D-Ala carboxypeptidase